METPRDEEPEWVWTPLCGWQKKTFPLGEWMWNLHARSRLPPEPSESPEFGSFEIFAFILLVFLPPIFYLFIAIYSVVIYPNAAFLVLATQEAQCLWYKWARLIFLLDVGPPASYFYMPSPSILVAYFVLAYGCIVLTVIFLARYKWYL